MELRSKEPFALEYDGHEITGVVRVATAAEKIRHSARVDRARSTDDQEAIIIAMDDAVDAVLVGCNITVDGQGLDEVARELYVDYRANDLYNATATHVRFLYILSTKFYLN